MIEAIGEVQVHQNRVEQTSAVNDRLVVSQRKEKELEERRIEEPETGGEAQADAEQDARSDKGETRLRIENKRLIIEKYNKDGDLMLQLPPVHSDEA